MLLDYIGVNHPPRFWDGEVMRVMGSSLNIIMSYNVQEYEMKTLSKSGDFSEIQRFTYN